MAVNLAQIRSLLLPGLYAVDGQYQKIEKEWSKLFKVQKSTLAIESKAQMRILGLPQLKTEGGATAFDNNAGQRYIFNAESFEVGLGYAITRKSIDDNQYKKDFNLMNLKLIDSFNQFQEIQAANILNTATTYNSSVGGDGVALCSTAHPYDLGTWANTFGTQLDLNESSLLQACLNIRANFVDEAGLKIYARPKELVVPVALIPVADRLTKTELRPGTANNDVNAIISMEGGIRKGDYLVNDYLTSNYAWFVTTNIDGLVMMDRIPFETDMWVDNITDNVLTKGYQRYTPAYNDPRCIWGSFPSA
jgi:hypothetical protein